MLAKQLHPPKVLSYSVHGSSGYSANYRAENVRTNEPTEQASRWSSAANDQNQFLLLKLDRLALLVHVCNLREFKVYAGPDLDSLHLIVHSGLSNDTEPESFPPDWSLAQRGASVSAAPLECPVQYIKIVPIAAWGSNFNFSIWFVELRGWDAEEPVESALQAFRAAKETATTRLVLKFLRDRGHDDAFHALQQQTACALEDPVATRLHQLLLHSTTLPDAEALLQTLFLQNPQIFDEYIHNHVSYVANWTRLDSPADDSQTPPRDASQYLDENGDYRMADRVNEAYESSQPCPRGGHQMVWDSVHRALYLFGGWDGQRDLGDLWRCMLGTSTSLSTPLRWELLSIDVERDGGPGARSCHKMVFCAKEGGALYVLGRYIEPDRRGSEGVTTATIPNDLFKYAINTGTWTRLSADVRQEGGPPCIYDHQMVIDEDRDCLWLFGGRCLSGANSGHSPSGDPCYAGLYRYELPTGRWTLVRPDPPAWNPLTQAKSPLPSLQIPSRIGHSMLLDPATRSLLILSGQRHKDYLADLYCYAMDRDAVTHVQKSLHLTGGPEAGFTQRACIDPQRREVFVFSGLMRGSLSPETTLSSRDPAVSESRPGGNGGAPTSPEDPTFFWCLDLDRHVWTRIHPAQPVQQPRTGGIPLPLPLPVPRFAHQVAYDPVTRCHYLFGGNPGLAADPSARLGDFWRVAIDKRIAPSDILRKCRYAIRSAIFDCLVQSGESGCELAALRYLQTELAQVVKHDCPVESAAFRALSTRLFVAGGRTTGNPPSALFDEIVRYLPEAMQPPRANL